MAENEVTPAPHQATTPSDVQQKPSNNDYLLNQESNGIFVNKVSVKIPPFWAERPEIWFAQIEAQFCIAGISSDITKFNTVIASIESHVLAQITEAVLQPPAEGKYENLKKCIIDRFGESEEKKMKKLLSECELGDRRPTQLLRELSGLARDRISNEFLKSLWLQRLPPQTRAILQASTSELPELAKLADKIMEVSDHNHVAMATRLETQVEPTSESSRIERIERQLDQLQRKQSRPSAKRPSSKFTTKKSAPGEFCWFHTKFGRNAQKCRDPCGFNSKSKN
ncbi:uncharacterized protein LOC118753187 [Rhagoletis pomonella]|uniref:uncharacterized protein LOC118753178 n=2 Tax=Rhagoletis pomonella TaxID=28610 RepID=UPI00177EB11B|nr:uncharacterized protein LOC118753178 [Rhagoletis pomonella]XP_036343943.1 uncharacterized protein LOC118753180 [Rhagoletis pomonella]XP_036343950.1 uncharacterized protein LOC118753187 [Rhagoletis pomonella]